MSTKTPESQFSTTSKVQEVVSASPQKRAALQVDILEPRILLSGTWVEVAAVEEVAQRDAAIEDPSVWMEEKGGIYGTERNDWLKGTDSNDVLVGLEGDDVLYGGDGNDRFVYRDGDGVDQYIGGGGQDQIDATRATSLVLGEIHEKYSIEYIVGGEKGLTIESTKESNYLDFSQVTLKNVSAIDAGYGDDVVIGSRADDVIIAGSGNDFLSGSEGENDVLVLSGNRSDYKVGELSSETLIIADRRGIDGEDQVTGFERYQFADGTVSRDELFNHAPLGIKLDGGSISESAEPGTVVGKLYTADADKDDAHNYELVDAKGNAVKDSNFVIKDNVIVVRDGNSLDYENATSQTLFVKTTDKAGASYIEEFAIHIDDTNDAPTAIKLDGGSVSESAEPGSIVGKLYTSDTDKGDSHTYQLVDAKGNAVEDPNFIIKDNVIVVRDGNSLDYETESSQTLFVKTTDKAGASHIEEIAIRIDDSNDAPVAIKLDGGSVSEAAEPGTVVGRLYTADADKGDAHTYELVDAKGNAVKDSNFAIKDNVIVVRDDNSLDYETASSQTLFVKTTDKAGASYIEEFTIHIDDANDAPVAIKLDGGSISESAELGTIVGKLYTSDADNGDAHTYQLVDSKGNAVKDPNFIIKDNAVVVRDGHTLDFESGDLHTLHVQVTDKAGALYIEEIAIHIEDANDAPITIKLDGGSVSESAETGTIVGQLYTSDADKVDSHTYQLVDSKGNAVDDSNFLIKENMIVVRDGNSLDYETSSSQTLFVKTIDKAGASRIEEIAIRIDDANEAPIGVTGMITTSEDIPVAVRLGGIDLDARDTIELVRIDQLPPHGQLLLRGSPVALGENISYDDITSGQLVFVSEKDWHGDTRLSFSVFDGEKWSEASADVALHVEAIADGASLTIEPARGLVGESVPLRLEALSLDSDGSEQLIVRISRLPQRCSLSAGVRETDGTWLLAASDLPALMLMLPQEAQQFDLAITVTSTEDNGSASTTTGSLHVTVDAPVSIVPVSSPLTGSPNPGFLSTDSESVARHIEYTGSVLEVTTEVPSRESSVLAERPVEDLSPVGDMFVTIRNQSIDWTETKFGDIHEIAPHERPETQSEPSTSRPSVSDQDQAVEDTAIASTTTESVSGFVWMWSTVRALTGMRDDRKNR